MSTTLQTWSASSIDTIKINSSNCNLNIEGINEDLVFLDDSFGGSKGPHFIMDPDERWLRINAPNQGNANITLKLSASKPWIIDILAGHGNVNINNIHSRMRILHGHGDIRIQDYQGLLALVSGHSNIHLNHFIQTEMPQPSPPAERLDSGIKSRSTWDWLHWDETDWGKFGENLGEKIGWWAVDVARLFESGNVTINSWGLRLQSSNGNLDLEDIQSKTTLLKTSHGNLKLYQASIRDLEVNLAKGDIECKAIIPTGHWKARTSSGNIRLSLPENISARLDMATRSGSIRSEIPMVRVSRPGPECYSGSRMVGSIGSNSDSLIPDIYLSTVHGNIEIESGQAYRGKPDMPDIHADPATQPSENIAESAAGPHHDRDTEIQTNTPLGILKALREGRISIDEADQLLKALEI